MSYNGSGTFVINSAGQPVVTGTVITTTAFNALTADLGTGLSTAITKDGQTTPTANIPMGAFKITGLGAGTAGTDAVRLSQLQAGGTTFLTAAGTDTITATASPSLTAYATGNLFTFVVANTNTGAVTLNVDGLGAKAITRDGTTALAAADLVAAEVVVVVYDGTRFQVVNPNAATNFRVTGTLGVTGATTLSSTLGVTGAATLSSTLGVTGVASFADLIDASGAAAGQLKFPAAQNASSNANTLDDYEEGVWTPTIISSGGGAPTYISQTGRYIKIGKQVFASAVIDLATAGTLAAGTLSVGGFPFTVNNSLASRATGTCSWANFSTSFINVLLRMAENTTTAEVIGATAAVATNSSVSQANFGATGGLRFGITYEASA